VDRRRDGQRPYAALNAGRGGSGKLESATNRREGGPVSGTRPPGRVVVRRTRASSGFGLLPRQLEQGPRVTPAKGQLVEVSTAGEVRLGV
jgi:hypothetical protein